MSSTRSFLRTTTSMTASMAPSYSANPMRGGGSLHQVMNCSIRYSYRSSKSMSNSSSSPSSSSISTKMSMGRTSRGTGTGTGSTTRIGTENVARYYRSKECRHPRRHDFPAPIRLHQNISINRHSNLRRSNFNSSSTKTMFSRQARFQQRYANANVHDTSIKINTTAKNRAQAQNQYHCRRPFATTNTCRLFNSTSMQSQYQQRGISFLRNQTTRSKSKTTKSSSSSSSTSHFSSASSRITVKNLKNKLQLQLLQPRIIPIPRWISPRPFSFTISECFGHASFILVAISYATDDFLLLRIIAVAGSTSMLFFTYFHPHGRILWLPFKWNLLFILINTYRIVKSLYYHYIGYYIMMSDEDKRRVKEDYFDIMDMSDFAKLCSIATEEVLAEGEMVVFQGSKNPYVRMVVEGELDVLRDGVRTYSLGEGNFVTEAGLHAGLFLTGTVESCCTIVAHKRNSSSSSSDSEKDGGKVAARCLRWNRTELMNLLNQNSGLRRSLKAILSWDIVRKLKGQRQTISDHMVEDAEFWTQKRQEQSANRYAAILQNMLQNPEYFKKHKNALDHYRTIHHIDDDRHKQALKTCGWTPSEYEAGERMKDEDDGIV